MTPISRRLLLLGAALASISTVAAFWAKRTQDCGVTVYGASGALDLFRYPESALVVGERCWKCLQEQDENINSLEIYCRMKPADWKRSRHEIKFHISQQSRRDFSEGRTLVIDGWILSRAEASFYALAALRGSIA